MIKIKTLGQYRNAKIIMRVEPLINKHFDIEHDLRIEIQQKLFGKHTAKDNQKFYKFMWENSPHYCEECQRPLMSFSSAYISHILSRGAFCTMAHDPRNINILCYKHHQQWENLDRENMRIYKRNVATIEKLKQEYEQ